MSLDKAIAAGREHRRQYRGAGAVDTRCRPPVRCAWCRRRLRYWRQKQRERVDQALKEWMDGHERRP